MTTIRTIYSQINQEWTAASPLPPLTRPEARTAVKRLWRWAAGHKLPYKIDFTSGRRYTWERRGTLYINVGRGWQSFVHDLSHLAWRRMNHSVRPHEKGHAKLELRMQREVLKHGYIDSALKREVGTVEIQPSFAQHEALLAARAARTAKAEKREARTRGRLFVAEKELQALQKKIAKLRAKVKYYDRRRLPPGEYQTHVTTLARDGNTLVLDHEIATGSYKGKRLRQTMDLP